MPSIYAVHYAEIALKGQNRPEFVRSLRRNLRRVAVGLGDVKVESKDGRFILETSADQPLVESALSKVFGVAWYAKASQVDEDYAEIKEAILSAARGGTGSFMIAARRSDKTFPLGSMELARRLGGDVVADTGRRVDLSEPAATFHVDVLRGRALVYSEKRRGLGGLPVGTGGRVMHLFSGGIDSPVAAWLLMKRGCQPIYVHFFLAPTAEYALDSKVARLVRLLTEYTGRSSLLLIPFTEYQLATVGAPFDSEPSLFRRFMRVTAEELALLFRANAVSTGDSLSQAASQTIWNIGVFDSGSKFPILRPLLGYDKEEIVQLAKRIGTYEPSIEEYRDCCAIITRHPKTRVKGALIDTLSDFHDFPSLARRCISHGTMATYDLRKERPDVTPLNDLVISRRLRATKTL
ncbi:MAG: tRNA 4-thiouridine(8) synthase ThiI [Nitrososphaerales archaeon]|nr:tRNA 4-thiouridine(8) synthase ThiI [Nitrososphaerales archaeon]